MFAELAPVSTNSPPPLFVLKGGLYPGHHGAYATKILEAGIVGIKGFRWDWQDLDANEGYRRCPKHFLRRSGGGFVLPFLSMLRVNTIGSAASRRTDAHLLLELFIWRTVNGASLFTPYPTPFAGSLQPPFFAQTPQDHCVGA